MTKSRNFGLGVALGAAIGIAIGVATHNPAVWLPIGVALGVGFGSIRGPGH